MPSRRTLLKASGLSLSSALVVLGLIASSDHESRKPTPSAPPTEANRPSVPKSLEGMTRVGNGWVGTMPPEVQPHGVLVYNTGSVGHRLEGETVRDGKLTYRSSGIPLESNTYVLERLTIPASYSYHLWDEDVEVRFDIDESQFSHRRSATAVEFTNGDAYVRTANGVEWYSLFEENEPTSPS